MSRTWTCRGCGELHPRVRQKCPCGRKRPTRKTAAQKALTETYERWVERFGDRCGICGRQASQRRRLDRDHDHRTGQPRGLLCARCNRALPTWVTPDWLRAAASYIEATTGEASVRGP